jgi:hypothetical protein
VGIGFERTYGVKPVGSRMVPRPRANQPIVTADMPLHATARVAAAGTASDATRETRLTAGHQHMWSFADKRISMWR